VNTSKLRVIMAIKGWGVKELSNHSGVSYGTCSNAVNGKKIRLDSAYDIAEALGMHIDKVFPGHYSYANRTRSRRRA